MDITLRILFRPQEKKLPWIYANIGGDYDERVLPSITTEVLKGVVVSVCAKGVCTLVDFTVHDNTNNYYNQYSLIGFLTKLIAIIIIYNLSGVVNYSRLFTIAPPPPSG